MAVPVEMPFCGLAQMGPRNHVLDGGSDPPREGAILGVVQSIEKHWKSAVVYMYVCRKRIVQS